MSSEVQSIPVNNGQQIHAKLFVPSTNAKKLTLLFLHGWTGRPNEAAAEVMAQQGYYSLTISMRGHGESDGDIQTVTSKDSLDDALAAYDFLVKRIPKGTQIAAVGNSYGSYIAVLLSEQRELAALSLRVPAAYPDNLENLPKWRRGHEDPVINEWRKKPTNVAENRGLTLLHKFPGAIQIIEAEKDEVVPSQTVKNYVNAIADAKLLEYKLMKGWAHSLGGNDVWNKEFQTVLLSWANKVERGL